jgi:hypothetical protein
MKLIDLFSGKMNPKEARRWEKIRLKGKKQFILWHGVLGWGLTMTLCSSITRYFKYPNDFNFIVDSLVSLCVWPLFGYLMGVIIWGYSEDRYLKYKEKI